MEFVESRARVGSADFVGITSVKAPSAAQQQVWQGWT